MINDILNHNSLPKYSPHVHNFEYINQILRLHLLETNFDSISFRQLIFWELGNEIKNIPFVNRFRWILYFVTKLTLYFGSWAMKLSAFFCNSSCVGNSFNFSFSWLFTWTTFVTFHLYHIHHISTSSSSGSPTKNYLCSN